MTKQSEKREVKGEVMEQDMEEAPKKGGLIIGAVTGLAVSAAGVWYATKKMIASVITGQLGNTKSEISQGLMGSVSTEGDLKGFKKAVNEVLKDPEAKQRVKDASEKLAEGIKGNAGVYKTALSEIKTKGLAGDALKTAGESAKSAFKTANAGVRSEMLGKISSEIAGKMGLLEKVQNLSGKKQVGLAFGVAAVVALGAVVGRKILGKKEGKQASFVDAEEARRAAAAQGLQTGAARA